MDGDKYRMDVEGRVSWKGEVQPKITYGLNWPQKGQYINWQRNAIACISERNGGERPFWDEVSMFSVLPSKLGLNACFVAQTYATPWDHIVTTRINITESASDRGPDYVVLKGQSKFSSAECTTIHSRKHSHYPVHHSIKSTKDGVAYEVTIDNELEISPQDQIVFTRRYERKQSKNRDLYLHDQIDVLECQFNQPIPPQKFTLRDLNMSLGREVRMDLKDDKSIRYWDGSKLVDRPVPEAEKKIEEMSRKRAREQEAKRLAELEEMPSVPEVNSSGKAYLYAGIAFLLMGTLFFLRRLLGKRHHE